MTARIAIVGSFNIDLVVRTPKRPRSGETVLGTSADTYVGGKGCNQGIAAARLGARVSMVGRVGRDHFGEQLLRVMEREGIDSTYVSYDQRAPTGIASIMVSDDGDNSIVVIPGANGLVSAQDVDAAAGALAQSDVVLLQLEVPIESTLRAAELAKRSGVRVILNPAPARDLPLDLLRRVDVLVPNELEAQLLTGVDPSTDPSGAAKLLLEMGIQTVIITLGRRGAFLMTGDMATLVPTFMVQPVDTTAAGDAFCGALAVAISEGKSLQDAVRFSNAAGAIAATKAGAEPSLPYRDEVDRLVM